MSPDPYRSYLIRSWQESVADDAEARWYGEVESIQTGQRWRFHNPEAMLSFIRTQVEALASDVPVNEESSP